MNLIVISNRVARPRAEDPAEGGLAAALLPAVRTSGAIWIGSGTRHLDVRAQEPLAEIEPLGAGAVVSVDLPRHDYRGFYEGFSNSALWPVLHSRLDLVKATAGDYEAYRAVNVCMARAVLRFATPESVYWVHDYHFLPLAAELRRLRLARPIGFFLHTPFPAREVMLGLPRHRELVQAMLAYDLVGFQTDEDRLHFSEYVQRELGHPVIGEQILANGARTRLATCPIGIDVALFAEQAVKAAGRPDVARLRASLQDLSLAIGVDRIDYSKGLANRFQAFDRLLTDHPHLRRAVSLLQIAVPSRAQIDTYRQLRAELAALVGEINGRHAEVDWTPIRYMNRGFPQSTLAGFYRAARTGLITSLQDGMNLVAKEYVAAQNPADPGVLVLSRFAGAAQQLDAALLVNPHDIDELARCMARSLAMPLAERRERWEAMHAALEKSSLRAWFADFVRALAACPPRLAEDFSPLPVPPAVAGGR